MPNYSIVTVGYLLCRLVVFVSEMRWLGFGFTCIRRLGVSIPARAHDSFSSPS
ncbi:hypothetical protein BJX70DRAFT_384914 [Aspergillus crustosus]